MDTLAGTGRASRSRWSAAFSTALPAFARRPTGLPVLLFGLVMALALLSFFVQVLDEHVQRAEQRLQSQYLSVAPSKPARQAAVPDAARTGLVQTAAR